VSISLPDLLARAKALAENEQFDEAWQVVEPLTDRVGDDIDVARVWVGLASFSALNDAIGDVAAEIIARHREDSELVARAASLLSDVAEQRPMDLAPLANGPARIAADAFQRLLDERPTKELYTGLAMALRLTGSQDDDAAMAAMESALRLDPEDASLYYRLGLLHKWRGRWVEGMRANQRAVALGADGEGVRWNLAICATAAGEHAVAGPLMQELGMKGNVGEDGRYVGTFAAVQVRVSGLGEGIDPAAHVVGSDPGFENLWIERDSLCTGKIANATYYDMVVDYGDSVLFDGAPVSYRDDGEIRTPRFPLLQKLRDGDYRRYRFRARQPRAGFLDSLTAQLPEGTFFYVHDEQVNLFCPDCARSDRPQHQHEKTETFLVTGKFVVPERQWTPALIPMLDDLIADPALVAIPLLYADLGDEARARRDEERWADLEKASAESKRMVPCATHGASRQTYVCQHLVTGKNLGFITAEAPGEEFPDAWCGDCERVRIAEGGDWNERSEAFASVTMICSRCYVAAREKNRDRKKKWWPFGPWSSRP
jgi:tetratricopeptide (TPR) repeat protein